MTPKEKAKELVNKFGKSISKPQSGGYKFNIVKAKDCALIAVDEILDDDMYDMSEELFVKRIEYWQKVKEEIENL